MESLGRFIDIYNFKWLTKESYHEKTRVPVRRYDNT